MIPVLVTPDLRTACLSLAHFPGDDAALEPYSTSTTGATLRADYRCPCGAGFALWWSASSAPWPLKAEDLNMPQADAA